MLNLNLLFLFLIKLMKISRNFYLFLECVSTIENLFLHYSHPSPSTSYLNMKGSIDLFKYSLIALFEHVVKDIFIFSLYLTMLYHIYCILFACKSVNYKYCKRDFPIDTTCVTGCDGTPPNPSTIDVMVGSPSKKKQTCARHMLQSLGIYF